MECICCGSVAVTEWPDRTAQGYRRFRRRDCGKQLNERSADLLNRVQYPSDVIALVVLWRLRYRLTLRDLDEIFLQRGIVFSYEAVRDWDASWHPSWPGNSGSGGTAEAMPAAATGMSTKRASGLAAGGATCIAPSTAMETMLSEHRDMAAAQTFFRSAMSATGQVPAM
jgi:hypothetical protein